jgi:hypothetical protein
MKPKVDADARPNVSNASMEQNPYLEADICSAGQGRATNVFRTICL